MIVVDQRRPFGLTLRHAFFPDRPELEDLLHGISSRTVLRVRQTNAVIDAHPWLVQRTPSATGLIDLEEGAEKAFARMSRTTRRQVERVATLGDRIRITHNDPASQPAYRQLHNAFVRHRGHATPIGERELADWTRVGDLFLVYLDERPVVGHVNVPDRALGRVVGQFEASARQQLSREEGTLVGICNRYLYWVEMQHYAASGMRWLDVGGLRDDADPITGFKLSLGARRVEGFFYAFARPAIRLALRLHRARVVQGLHWLRGGWATQ